MDMEKLEGYLPLIDREIERVFPRHGLKNLNDAAWYHFETGGKKLRPMLALATCEALGSPAKQIAPFAAACEVLHNWLLVHDDIEDGDRMRRDKPTVWVKYGLAHGVNVGDYMSQKVFELILLSKDYGVDNEKVFKLVDSMVRTAVKTSEGQTMDINLRCNDHPTEKDYMEMVTGKTAHYLTVTMVGAAIVAGRDELIPRLIAFGSQIGPAFQMTDDIIDLTEGKGRGEVGRDVKEGKRSILAVHCLSKCSTEEKKNLIHILNKPPEETSDGDVSYVKHLFEKYGSIEYAWALARKLQAEATDTVKKMPPELRPLLEFFADKLVNRRK